MNRLDVTRAAEITRDTCASPTSLVLALMYLDRLRSSNSKYLGSISSTDLFLVSLMVASKYLYDDGEEDEVFNEEWATSGNIITQWFSNEYEARVLYETDPKGLDLTEFRGT